MFPTRVYATVGVPGLALAVAALLALAAPVSAQSSPAPLFGIGYVADAPQIMAGGAAWSVLPGLHGWGVYVDFKLDPEDPAGYADFNPSLTVADVVALYPADEEVDQEQRWQSYNAAVVRQLTDELLVYAGGGYSQQTTYRQMVDPDRNRGRAGFYWVEDPAVSDGGVNLLAGAFVRISSRFRIQFGGETRPKGFTVGASVVFPAR